VTETLSGKEASMPNDIPANKPQRKLYKEYLEAAESAELLLRQFEQEAERLVQENLDEKRRAAKIKQIERNRRRRLPKNTSGVTGVSRHKAKNRWQASITVHGTTHFLGAFKTFDEAVAARRQAEQDVIDSLT